MFEFENFAPISREMSTMSKKTRKSRSLKSSSVNAKVEKFDAAVLRFVKTKPSEAKLVRFIQDEWLRKTKSVLPTKTAVKIAKKMSHLTAAKHFKMGKTRKQRGGAGYALMGAPLSAPAMGPGNPAVPVLNRMPTDINTEAMFGSSSPVAYYSAAQARGCGAGEFDGYGPGASMGSNEVPKTRSRSRKQRGGAAYTIPASQPMSVIPQEIIRTTMGQHNPVYSTGNPVIPGFKMTYSPLAGTLDDSAQRITSSLPLVWKQT